MSKKTDRCIEFHLSLIPRSCGKSFVDIPKKKKKKITIIIGLILFILSSFIIVIIYIVLQLSQFIATYMKIANKARGDTLSKTAVL